MSAKKKNDIPQRGATLESDKNHYYQKCPKAATYYSELRYRKKVWEFQKSRESVRDSLFHSLLQLVGGEIGKKLAEKDIGKYVFVVGEGDFDTISGKTSPHKGFWEYFILRV